MDRREMFSSRGGMALAGLVGNKASPAMKGDALTCTYAEWSALHDDYKYCERQVVLTTWPYSFSRLYCDQNLKPEAVSMKDMWGERRLEGRNWHKEHEIGVLELEKRLQDAGWRSPELTEEKDREFAKEWHLGIIVLLLKVEWPNIEFVLPSSDKPWACHEGGSLDNSYRSLVQKKP